MRNNGIEIVQIPIEQHNLYMENKAKSEEKKKKMKEKSKRRNESKK